MPTILSCLVLAGGLAACGSSSNSGSKSSSSSSGAAAATSSTSSTPTTTSSATSQAAASCQQLLTAAMPKVTPGTAPSLKSLESKALHHEQAAFAFSGQTCVAPSQEITLTGEAQLKPNLVVEGKENVAGHTIEIRFIGSAIYIYLPQIASRDGGKPWLRADLKKLSSASGLDFSQLLDEVRQLSPNSPSPLLKAASTFKPQGRASIAGHTVYAYGGTFSPDDLAKLGLPGQLGKQTASKLKQLGATREQVTTFLTSDAVALRTVTVVYKKSGILTVAVNASQRLARALSVSPPPAGKTIDYSKVAGSGA